MALLTPYQRAWQTLADHAIQPHFRRSGNQVAALIEEAVTADRVERAPEAGTAPALLSDYLPQIAEARSLLQHLRQGSSWSHSAQLAAADEIESILFELLGLDGAE